MSEAEIIGKIEQLYYSVRDIPNKDKEHFAVVSMKARDPVHYSHFIAKQKPYLEGYKARMKIWEDKILPLYHNSKLEESNGNHSLTVRVSNHVFRSRLTVKTDSLDLIVLSPKGSTFFSHIFGSRIVARLKRR